MKKTFLMLVLVACGTDGTGLDVVGLDASEDASGIGKVMHTPDDAVAVPPMGGTAGTSVAEGGSAGSTTGGQGAASMGGAPTLPVCEEGEVVFEADYWCEPWDSPSPNAQWRDQCVNGVVQGYYQGLPCPFDVVVAHGEWTSACPGCVDGIVITNGGASTSAAWRGNEKGRYCCDGRKVRFGK